MDGLDIMRRVHASVGKNRRRICQQSGCQNAQPGNRHRPCNTWSGYPAFSRLMPRLYTTAILYLHSTKIYPHMADTEPVYNNYLKCCISLAI